MRTLDDHMLDRFVVEYFAKSRNVSMDNAQVFVNDMDPEHYLQLAMEARAVLAEQQTTQGVVQAVGDAVCALLAGLWITFTELFIGKKIDPRYPQSK